MHIPRLLIAGTHSGVGKTTIAVGLMAALKRRGLTVQPFKVGPDYLDPAYHRIATGRISRNLDSWLLRRSILMGLFQQAASDADLALVEGVMGLFDGHSAANDQGSSAQIAKWFQIPVILVIDGSAMARSVAPLVKGFLEFDPALRIAGVIVNKVSQRHAQWLCDVLRRYNPVPMLGYLPQDSALTIPERHLGLVPAQEDSRLAAIGDRLAEMISRSVDLTHVFRIARGAPALSIEPGFQKPRQRASPSVRIGIAQDRAFHFYYPENLELLQIQGAQLVSFSPLQDKRLPESLDALYLGGGFPELFAEALADNRSMRLAVRRAIASGLPTYAECGGLMYLTQSLTDLKGRRHPMVGILPGAVRMTDRLHHFGYATLVARRENVLAQAKDSIKGHEFHYSVWDHPVRAHQAAYTVIRKGQSRRLEGMVQGNLLASYVHVHWLTNPRWARGLVTSAQRWRRRCADSETK